jgi:hypothetical protein
MNTISGTSCEFLGSAALAEAHSWISLVRPVCCSMCRNVEHATGSRPKIATLNAGAPATAVMAGFEIWLRGSRETPADPIITAEGLPCSLYMGQSGSKALGAPIVPRYQLLP